MSSEYRGQQLELILNSTHDGIVAVDASGVVTLFNAAAERIMGIPRAEVLGALAIEKIPNTRLHLVLAGGKEEKTQLQKLGETTIITSRMPVRDEAGRTVGAVAVFRDITEIQALTDQVSGLWQAKNLLAAVLEAAEDAISVADEHGNNILVNPAYTRITGLPKEKVLNKPVTVDIAEGESMHMQVLRTGKPVRNVRMKVGPMGRDVVVNVAPVVIDGEIKGSAGVIHDISEIMRLTEELTRTKGLLRHYRAKYRWDDIIGTSDAISLAKEQALNAAMTPATVLLRGESGTGKELFAHAIHGASSRGERLFLRVNCSAFAESLLESELFGYEEGAFTGAVKGGRKGLFEQAEGGTLFLDEIGELGPSLQSKLLRALQEREIVRVGGSAPTPVDVRIIAATNADLERKVREGGFREDLYYRLNVIPITIRPLRHRREDIPLIAQHLIFRLNQDYGRTIKALSAEAVDLLVSHDWPGNVRELENILSRAMIAVQPEEDLIEPRHIAALGQHRRTKDRADAGAGYIVQPLEAVVERAEREAILAALGASGGNRTRAAAALGISIRSLYYKIERHRISGA